MPRRPPPPWWRGSAAGGAQTVTAHIHPAHQASMGVAQNIGLTATHVLQGGETLWVCGTE